MKKTERSEEGYLVFCDSGFPVHRWVATKKYGKEKIKGKEIHHIDGNKENNNNDNLILLSKEDHFLLHNYLKKNKNVKNAFIGGLISLLLLQALFMILLYPLSIVFYVFIGIAFFVLYKKFMVE
ncbi:MAG: HNH endonuclease [Nanobdellota archaeon]